MSTAISARQAKRADSLDNYERIEFRIAHRDTSRLLRIRRRLIRSVRRVAECELPFYRMSILFDEDVLICCYDWNGTTIVGNVRARFLR